MQSVCHQKFPVFFFWGGSTIPVFFRRFANEFSGSPGRINLQETWSHACGDKAHQSLGMRGVKTRGCFLVENCLKPGTGSSGWCFFKKPENVNNNSKSEFSLSSFENIMFNHNHQKKTLTLHTLPPIIMVQWPIGVSPIVVSFSFGVVFHFHDYGRKGNDSFGRCWWEMLWIRKYGHGLHADFNKNGIDMGKLHVRKKHTYI